MKQPGLRCPFGCRQRRDGLKSAERTKDYYQSPEGKAKKRELNKKRNRKRKDLQVQPEVRLQALVGSFPSKALIDHAICVATIVKVTISRGFVLALLNEAHASWRQLSLAPISGVCDISFWEKKGTDGLHDFGNGTNKPEIRVDAAQR